jgi:MFS family permease
MNKKQLKLKKLQADQARPYFKGYFVVLFVVIALARMANQFSTDLFAKTQTLYTGFFLIGGSRGMSVDEANGLVALWRIPSYVIVVVAPLYKALMDKIGRKPLFVLNKFGLGLGALICFFAPFFEIFMLGFTVMYFFYIQEMHPLYIMEEAPPKHRATITTATICVGILATVMIPILRGVFITDDNPYNFQPLYLIGAIACAVAGVICFFTMRETRVFVNSQVENLSKTDEQRAEDAKKAKEDAVKQGIIPSFKYVFKDKNLRFLAIAVFLVSSVMIVAWYDNEAFLGVQGLSESAINMALIAQPISMALLLLLSGFLGDKIGRKKTIVIYICVLLVSAALFIFGAQTFHPILSGIFWGGMTGGYISLGILFTVMFAELAPTEIRGGVNAIYTYVLGIGNMIGIGVSTILLPLQVDLTIVKSVIIFPMLTIALIFVIFKVKESTKQKDLIAKDMKI